MEISESLEQRTQAYRGENHPLREINQVIIGRAQNRGISENEISDAQTIVVRVIQLLHRRNLGRQIKFKFAAFNYH